MTTPMDVTKLPDYLQRQRWFSGKAWPIKHADVVDHVTLERPDGTRFLLAVVEVVYEVVHPERYLLLVSPSAEGIQDALEDDEALRTLFTAVRERRTVTGSSGRLRGEWLDAEPLALAEPLSVRRLQVEQSNTSVVLGEQVILKVIRKVEPGINPEHEVGRFLTTRTRFRATPTLLGALHLEGPSGATVALAHRYVPNAVDGWRHTLARFRAERTLPLPFLEELRDLGQRVGEFHQALASAPPEEPGFAPEPLQTEDLQRWSASIVGELGVTLAEAVRRHPELESRREALIEQARRLAHLPPGGQKIRIHGDLHLGQVLRAEGRWLLFDFEGEPGRTFHQRRRKYCALRDVAGMLRSFEYAQATVDLEGQPAGDRARPAREAFWEGYRDATRNAAFLPGDEGVVKALLEALELEKLLYEVRYEMQNRPDWVRIPVQALMSREE